MSMTQAKTKAKAEAKAEAKAKSLGGGAQATRSPRWRSFTSWKLRLLAALLLLVALGFSAGPNFVFACSIQDQKEDQKNDQDMNQTKKFAIALHGGAGADPKKYSPQANQLRKQSLERALKKGVEILEQGGTALDATEQVVMMLEDDPQFNAGVGAVFNAEGTHNLDAAIMDGKTLACGAVAGVKVVKNPIELARLVMTDTRHVLLGGEGADEFAKLKGVAIVSPDYFDTPAARESWEQFKILNPELSAIDQGRAFVPNWDIGTVGCVALDSDGNLAAATSTGGITHKQFGRIGDSPIIGAGTFADNATCAVSGTGVGEQYIRLSVAYDVAAQMKYRQSTLQQAVDDNLKNRLNAGDGGIIAVDRAGKIVMDFNSAGMARAAADSSGYFEVLWD